MCGGCSAAVKGMLLKQPGVEAAAVNLLTETAAVTVKAGDAAQVTAAAEVLTKKVRASLCILYKGSQLAASPGKPFMTVELIMVILAKSTG